MKYLQVSNDNIITDCISYEYQGYVPFEGVTPPSVNGGWFKLENGVIVEYPELKPIDETEELKQRISDLELQVATLTGGV